MNIFKAQQSNYNFYNLYLKHQFSSKRKFKNLFLDTYHYDKYNISWLNIF